MTITRIKHWIKEYSYKDGILEYDSLQGWTYLVKGEKMVTIVRLPFRQKKEAIAILEKE
jgi:hypothetical protein